MSRRGERGSQAIEFGLNLLPFFGLVWLILSLAWALYTKATLQHAVAEGVRYAITSQTMQGLGQDASIKTVIKHNAMGLLSSDDIDSKVTIQYYSVDPTTGALTKTESNLGGNIVEVSVTGYTLNPLFPILSWGKDRSATNTPNYFTVHASDRMEGSPGGIPPKR